MRAAWVISAVGMVWLPLMKTRPKRKRLPVLAVSLTVASASSSETRTSPLASAEANPRSLSCVTSASLSASYFSSSKKSPAASESLERTASFSSRVSSPSPSSCSWVTRVRRPSLMCTQTRTCARETASPAGSTSTRAMVASKNPRERYQRRMRSSSSWKRSASQVR